MSRLDSIFFRNYKAFANKEEMEIRPITLLVGKNSSGKSSILKLLSVLQTAIDRNQNQLKLSNNIVSLGSRYEDLFHNHQQAGLLLGLCYDEGMKIEASYIIDRGNLYRYRLVTSKPGTAPVIKSYSSEHSFDSGLLDLDYANHNPTYIESIQFSLNYIGPIRKGTERTVDFSGYNNYSSVGLNGENAYQILLDSYLRDKKVYENVSKWMQLHLENQGLTVEQMNPMSGSYGFYIVRDGCKVNIADVGQGICQLLPILVEAFMDNHVDLVAIEQPELHVHPADHADIAYLLADSAKRFSKRYIIESHSANMLLAFRDLVSDKTCDFNKNDIIIYFVDHDDDGAFLQRIEIDENGALSQWPTGVFGESLDLMTKIMNNQRG